MSFFDGKIEWDESNNQFREMLEKWRDEIKTDVGVLWAISDDVFSVIGAEAIEEAQAIPLKASTIERKARAVKPKTKRRKRKQKRRDRMSHVLKSPGSKPFANNSFTGAVAAVSSLITDSLAAPGRRVRQHRNAAKNAAKGGLPVAHREFPNADSIVWGSKRWVDYLNPHIDGSKRGLPARLAMLQPKRFEAEAVPRIKDVMASWVGSKLEAAGAPAEWIQEITEGHF